MSVPSGAAKREEDKAREVLSELASASHVLDKQLHDSISRLANVLEAFFAPHVNALQVRACRPLLPCASVHAPAICAMCTWYAAYVRCSTYDRPMVRM